MNREFKKNINRIRISFFGQHLQYHYGGAEKSTAFLVKALKAEHVDVQVVSGTYGPLDVALEKYAYENLLTIKMKTIKGLKFLSYFINSFRIKRFFQNYESDLLLTQGGISPFAINVFNGKSLYFVRDEISLNIFKTYEMSLFKKIKFVIRYLLDLPFYVYFCIQNASAMHKAEVVVANSQFMAKEIKKKFGVAAKVIYPPVDVQSFGQKESDKDLRKCIIMMGDQEVKGVNTFLGIAKRMPQYQFAIYGRSFRGHKEGNVEFRPFETDVFKLYQDAKLVLVPSVWEEAFGRVSIEAAALGIPVLVSNRGGLPETVAHKDFIIDDYKNIALWVKKMNVILSEYEKNAAIVKRHSQKFDSRFQFEALRGMI